jgi:hypothetical protein
MELEASAFNEEWNYSSVIGMLLYQENTRPDIQFAVNQCAARFMQNPRVPHARAVKKICRYLKGTRDKGLCFKATPSDPNKPIRVDCYVDASFAPCWDVEDPMDPDAAKFGLDYQGGRLPDCLRQSEARRSSTFDGRSRIPGSLDGHFSAKVAKLRSAEAMAAMEANRVAVYFIVA